MSSKAFLYHPLRYRHMRHEPDYDELCLDYEDYKEGIYDKKTTAEEVAVEMGKTFYGTEGMTFDNIEDVMFMEEDWRDNLRAYDEAGKHIFALSPALVEMFKNTSVAEVGIDTVKMPYRTLYVYWGEAAGIRSPDGKIIDGAYIENHPGCPYGFFITLTVAIPDLQEVMKKPLLVRLSADQYREFDLSADDPLSIGEIYNNRFQSFHAGQTEEEYQAEEQAMIAAGLRDPDRDIEPLAKILADYRPDPDDVRWQATDNKAMGLIFNFLCYLSYEKRDVQHRYPKEAPTKLVTKANNLHKPSEARRAQNKLESLGYKKVYLCGESVRTKSREQGEEGAATHWRRGHWRNQACGEGRASHKMLWIEPTIVNPGNSPMGHIYEVNRAV